jgi:hypothetical protein
MAAERRTVEVCADWVGLGGPTRMGVLHATAAGGKEIFSFEYDEAWLAAGQRTALDSSLAPGRSLGGARPKASVLDEHGQLWIAKFPSALDDHDIGAWESVVSTLAVRAGVVMAEAKCIRFGGKHHTFLTKRFDRTNDNGRIHFASAMTLLARVDGEEGASYARLRRQSRRLSRRPHAQYFRGRQRARPCPRAGGRGSLSDRSQTRRRDHRGGRCRFRDGARRRKRSVYRVRNKIASNLRSKSHALKWVSETANHREEVVADVVAIRS